MKYLDHRYEFLQMFRGTLYHPKNEEFPTKQQIGDLKNVFEKFGAVCERACQLVRVVSTPCSTTTLLARPGE